MCGSRGVVTIFCISQGSIDVWKNVVWKITNVIWARKDIYLCISSTPSRTQNNPYSGQTPVSSYAGLIHWGWPYPVRQASPGEAGVVLWGLSCPVRPAPSFKAGFIMWVYLILWGWLDPMRQVSFSLNSLSILKILASQLKLVMWGRPQPARLASLKVNSL